MNTKAELQWWIEFGQKDIGRIKHKTRDKLEEALSEKLENYCSFWGATPDDGGVFFEHDENKIKIEQQEYLLKHQKGADTFVRHLKDVLGREKDKSLASQGPFGFDLVDIKFVSLVTEEAGGEFSSYVSVESELHQLVYFFMSLFMIGTKRENFKDCAYCGKLFLQVSRDKKFCTRNCAANSAKG